MESTTNPEPVVPGKYQSNKYTWRTVEVGIKPDNDQGVYVTPSCVRIPRDEFDAEFALVKASKPRKARGYANLDVQIWR